MTQQQRGLGAALLLGVALVGFWVFYGQQLWDDYQQDRVLGQLESVVEQSESEQEELGEEEVFEVETTTTEADEPTETTSTEADTGGSTADATSSTETTTTTTTSAPSSTDDTTSSTEAEATETTTTEVETTTTEATTPQEEPGPARAAGFDVVEILNHDNNAFTQGLEISDGRLFESTGIIGQSTIRELDLVTGDVIRITQVPEVFGEGLTIVGDTAIQLTWQDEIAFRYDLDSFEIIDTYTYDGEGWGLCNATEGSGNLVMSDGSSQLEFRDPETFESIGFVDVEFDGAPVENLNELECVGDTVWANIWLTDLIIEIDPNTGAVLTVIDAAELRPDSTTNNSGAVLNGLAYDSTTNTMIVTGKLWPVMYRLEIS